MGEAVMHLDDAPDVLGGVAELAASNAGTEIELADGDAVVFDTVGKVVVAFGHGTDENADALVGVQALNVVAYTHNLRVEAERDLAAVRGKVVGDGVLDDLDELLVGSRGADLVAMQQLHHQTGEALEGTRDAHGGVDLDEDAPRCLDVDLQLARLVDGRVEQRKQALYKWSVLGTGCWLLTEADVAVLRVGGGLPGG